MPKLSSSQAKLNTIQMGLAAIFNPDNYIQQQSRKLPFIPGRFLLIQEKAFCDAFLVIIQGTFKTSPGGLKDAILN